jgi:uroporphyrin-III C-methyltransferase/precorrin-2 dehydrogenase/sirohydrochlorin ferrochelatase
MASLLPLFLNLVGRDVLLVGGGRVAAGKLTQLLGAGARVRVVAPEIQPELDQSGVPIARRPFRAADLDGAWLVVAAATPEVNRDVAAAAETRRIFVNAVDDPANASAFLSGVVRRDGVTLAISTSGEAPALTALLREALDAVLPDDLATWTAEAGRQRVIWRRDRVPMEQRKPKLLEALNELYDERTLKAQASGRVKALSLEPEAQNPGAGHVSLVGAGPGDPGLLTRKAIARLRAADLVLYDALIDDRVLRYARKAQRFFVGKRAEVEHSGGGGTPRARGLSQQTIHAVMIRAARRGRRVVRLKGGDPFVFGRGGEEALALQRAGVPFDVVPGVTSALAAPALAGIPLTQRGVASAFLVVSGHDEQIFRSAIGPVGPRGVTLVVLMGLNRAAGLATILIDRGWAPATPSAAIFEASRSEQHVWRGTLDDLAADRLAAAGLGPATLVIGQVVALHEGRERVGVDGQKVRHVNG